MKYGLEFAVARRVRRTWRGTVLTVLTLLTVSALAGWLLHVVRSWMGTGWKAYATPPMPGLAMVPVTAIAVPVVIALMALLAFCAVRKARRERAALGQAYEGEWDPYAGDRPWSGETFEAHGMTWTRHVPGDPCPVPADEWVQVLYRADLQSREMESREVMHAGLFWWKSYKRPLFEIVGWRKVQVRDGKPVLPENDPLATTKLVFEIMPASISRMDVACICLALASEARLIRDMVRGAQRSLSVEDYGEGLEAAERRLGELRTRLWQLKAYFDGGLISAADEDDLPKSYGEAARNANAGGVS